MKSERFVRRQLTPLLIETIGDSPVTLIHGPRQCGKTTLSRNIGKTLGYSYYTFDIAETRLAAQNDPKLFLQRCSDRTILDEFQRVPQLCSDLKIAVDRNRKAGRFLLTGSANLLLMPELANSLVGRMETLRLHPFSQQEIEQTPSIPFLDRLFSGNFPTCTTNVLSKNLVERIVAGGYPMALNRSTEAKRSSWYRNYVKNIISRDVLDISKIQSIEALPKLLGSAVNLTGQLFNVSKIASKLQMTTNTVRGYLNLLEHHFLIERLPSWHANRMKRLIKTPKIHITDTGLASALLKVSSHHLINQRSLLGQLVESFVYQELRRQSSSSDHSYSFYHFRDRDGIEVDIVIERSAFELAGIEVKAGATIHESDFKGLRKIKSAYPDKFKFGAVLYDGETCASYGDGMYIIPIRMLWESEPEPLCF